MPILMESQLTQMDIKTLIGLLIKEKDRKLTMKQATELNEWKLANPELAKNIAGWNKVATLQRLVEEYRIAEQKAEVLLPKLHERIKVNLQ